MGNFEINRADINLLKGAEIPMRARGGSRMNPEKKTVGGGEGRIRKHAEMRDKPI